MKNIEKYEKELRKHSSYFAVDRHNSVYDCEDLECGECIFNTHVNCPNGRLDWLLSEYKEQLSDDEITILKNINKSYKWIVRDEETGLQIFSIKPFKSGRWWVVHAEHKWGDLSVFNHLFQGVKAEDEEPHSIDDLLKEYGVER